VRLLSWREDLLVERERQQKLREAREAREIALAEADMLAEERRHLERERRMLEDEKLAARLQSEANAQRMALLHERERNAIAQRIRNENWHEAVRLKREKEFLQAEIARLRADAENGIAHWVLADGSRIAVRVDRVNNRKFRR
jgi:hypothetical protein